jgi:hypothetical protein
MACGSCGGGGGAAALKVGLSSQPDSTEEMVMLAFVGPETQIRHIRSRVNSRRTYRFGGPENDPGRKFFVYKADADWITAMQGFVKVASPDVSITMPVALPILAAETREVSVEDQPIDMLGVKGEIITALRSAGYETIGEVKRLSLADLMVVRGLGKARARKVIDAVASFA